MYLLNISSCYTISNSKHSDKRLIENWIENKLNVRKNSMAISNETTISTNKLLVIVNNDKWRSKYIMHTNRIKYTEPNNLVT